MNGHRHVSLIARGVFIELTRKRALSVVALVAGLFVVGALAARVAGVDKPAVGTFLLNLGLSLAYWCAHILTLLLAAGQIPGEIESRTLYTLLARPVSRGSVLLGKWAACSLAGTGIYLALGLLAWMAAPKMETYDPVLLVQTISLAPFSISLLAASAILLSLVWTKGVSLVLLGILLFAGGRIPGFASRGAPEWMRGGLEMLASVLPDFSKLNLITRYTDGIGPVSFSQQAGLIIYALAFVAACLLLANRLFSSRAL